MSRQIGKCDHSDDKLHLPIRKFPEEKNFVFFAFIFQYQKKMPDICLAFSKYPLIERSYSPRPICNWPKSCKQPRRKLDLPWKFIEVDSNLSTHWLREMQFYILPRISANSWKMKVPLVTLAFRFLILCVLFLFLITKDKM